MGSKIFIIGSIASAVEGFICVAASVFILFFSLNFDNIMSKKNPIITGNLLLAVGIVEIIIGIAGLKQNNSNDAKICQLLCNVSIVLKSFLISNIFLYFLSSAVPVFNLITALTSVKEEKSQPDDE
ncbi:MAG: hypothetical protein LBH37_02380 [Oscillospiraceae bacterium]|jgi:hypothetical protein|nr:hypothetical protein [Oscillospiraceae bacterium]